MSADIMLICTSKGEFYSGRHADKCFYCGDTADDEALYESLFKILPPDKHMITDMELRGRYFGKMKAKIRAERWEIGCPPSSSWHGPEEGRLVTTDVHVEWILDDSRKERIIKALLKHKPDRVEECRYWLANHFGECIGLEFW